MDIEAILRSYGYAFLLIGTFVEGEAVLLVAGYLAFARYMDLEAVIAVAFLGTFVGDQACFVAGRRWGRILLRIRAWRRPMVRALRLLERYDVGFLFLSRFLYGLRTPSRIAAGMSPLGGWRFASINAGSVAAWSGLYASLGFLFGRAAEQLLGKAQTAQGWILAMVAGLAVTLWLARFLHGRLGTDR